MLTQKVVILRASEKVIRTEEILERGFSYIQNLGLYCRHEALEERGVQGGCKKKKKKAYIWTLPKRGDGGTDGDKDEEGVEEGDGGL